MATKLRVLVSLTAAAWVAAASVPAQEQTGVPAFAQAQWIAPPDVPVPDQPLPLFRKEFSVEAQPRKATLRIVGLGDYDARVNGRRLADTGINQPWSQYEDTIYYRDFDITATGPHGDQLRRA